MQFEPGRLLAARRRAPVPRSSGRFDRSGTARRSRSDRLGGGDGSPENREAGDRRNRENDREGKDGNEVALPGRGGGEEEHLAEKPDSASGSGGVPPPEGEDRAGDSEDCRGGPEQAPFRDPVRRIVRDAGEQDSPESPGRRFRARVDESPPAGDAALKNQERRGREPLGERSRVGQAVDGERERSPRRERRGASHAPRSNERDDDRQPEDGERPLERHARSENRVEQDDSRRREGFLRRPRGRQEAPGRQRQNEDLEVGVDRVRGEEG